MKIKVWKTKTGHWCYLCGLHRATGYANSWAAAYELALKHVADICFLVDA